MEERAAIDLLCLVFSVSCMAYALPPFAACLMAALIRT